MRKIKLISSVIALLLSLSMFSSAYAESAVVTGDGVNVRGGPGTNYRVIDCLDYGTRLNVSDMSNANWYAVEYGGIHGFILSSYLSVEQASYGNVTQYGTAAPAYINAMYVRFRSGPSQASSILGEYNVGKSVYITGFSGDWTACVIDGRSGYVYTEYLSLANTAVQGGNDYSSFGSFLPGEAPPSYGSIATPPPSPTPTYQPPQPTPTPTVQADNYGFPVNSYINAELSSLRTGPSELYPAIESYSIGKGVCTLSKSGEWLACVIDGKAGFIKAEHITRIEEASYTPHSPSPSPTQTPAYTVPTTQPTYTVPTVPPMQTPVPTVTAKPSYSEGYVCGNNVRMRTSASMTATIIGELFYGNKLTIYGTTGDWTAVDYQGVKGFIYSQYVKQGSLSYSATPSESTDNEQSSALGLEIARYALQFVGYNYAWGGASPATGFDCSGFVYYVYQQFGYTLNRIASEQAYNGVRVTDSMQAGDILCFYSSSDWIGHVGIYIGGNKFVHAQNSATGVVVSELSGYYTSRGFEVRRIV